MVISSDVSSETPGSLSQLEIRSLDDPNFQQKLIRLDELLYVFPLSEQVALCSLDLGPESKFSLQSVGGALSYSDLGFFASWRKLVVLSLSTSVLLDQRR